MFGKDKSRHFSSFQIIILGFLTVILAGSLLLMLPAASAEGVVTPFMDTLFTATSAVCVTGLIVRDTATYWSPLGQGIILALIQIGGMGVVTMSVAVAQFSGRKIGLRERSTMQEAISAPQVGGIVKLTDFIVKVTIGIELFGAALMAPVFCKEFGTGRGLWYALFHSISAFCNAGFDLMGVKKPFSSLTSYAGNPVINVVIMALIIVGGIGFLTWNDLKNNKWHWKKYRMQTKVILTVTAALILLPAVYFFFGEFSGSVWDDVPLGEKIWMSLFASVTTRTAGFNTVDFGMFSEAGQSIVIILMLIGGSPGSTAGGMKTTTVAVLLLSLGAVFRRQEDTKCFGRRIAGETVRYGAAVLLMYILLLLFGGLMISAMEGLPVLTCFFEAASAIGTVGLSSGITGGLKTASRLILILLMFLGRVGGMTLVFATVAQKRNHFAKLPQERITVG